MEVSFAFIIFLIFNTNKVAATVTEIKSDTGSAKNTAKTLFSKNNAQATTSQKTKKGHCKIINFWKLKKGFGMSILPDINTLIYTKLYLFGLRLHFCIGKNRIE